MVTRDSHTQGNSTGSRILRAALDLGAAGRPVVPCYHAPKKKPRFIEDVLEHGFNDATTNRSRINALWNKFPGASIGVRLAQIAVVDIEHPEKNGGGPDGFSEMEKLESKHGSFPRTRTHKTYSGGEQRLVKIPDGVEVSGGNTSLAPGVELLVNGGILVPPSPGYEVLDHAPMAEAPTWILEKLRERRPEATRRPSRVRDRVEIQSGEPIPDGERVPEGGRFFFLRSECGRLHNGTRDLPQLAEDLDAINQERCDPPWEHWEVEKLACSIFKLEPCKPRQSPELLEIVEVLERSWWDKQFPGIGGKTIASMIRALIREGKRIGTVLPGVGLRVQISVRNLAEIVNCHYNTIVNATRRAKAMGILRKDDYHREDAGAGAFVLLDPRLGCDNQTTSSSSPLEKSVDGVSQPSRGAPVAGLTTPHYRWRGLVGKGRERALCALEAFGPMTAEKLAEVLGWSRTRDLRSRYLESLTELGLIEDRGGIFALVGDHRERQEEVRSEPYSTVQARVRRIRSVEGLWVYQVMESGRVASEVEREHQDREHHARQREEFRRRFSLDTPEADEECRKLLNTLDDERDGMMVEFTGSELEELERVEPDPGEAVGGVIESVDEVFALARAWFKQEEVA